MERKPAAVIVGMEENGLGVARALSALNIPLIALAGPRWNPCCETDTCTISPSSSWTHEGVINDLKLIGKKLDAKAALLITKDEPVLWISESRQQIQDFYEIYLPDHDIVSVLMDKAKFYELAKKEGWPVPITWIANNKDEIISLRKDVLYPCILKPGVKNSEFRKHAPKKSFIIHSPRELIETYDMVAQWEKEVVIQEWIQGGDDRIAFCLTYYGDNSDQIASFPGRKLRQWPIQCGNTAISEPAPSEWVSNITTLTEKIWKAVRFKGLGSIEYKIEPRTNAPVIMEPTVGRTNYQSEVAVLNGVNIPAIAYCDLTKHGYVVHTPKRERVKLIDGKAEIKAALTYWWMGQLGPAQWIRDRSGKKKYMILRSNDLGPFVASILANIRRVLRKMTRLRKMMLGLIHFVGRKLRRASM